MGSFVDFKSYMDAKKSKLREQFETERESSANPTITESKILNGITIHINGYTSPSAQEIKQLLFLHGGTFEQYFSRSKVTHVIANNLPLAKVESFKNVKVVKPSWLVDSIAEGKILDWRKYRLEQFEDGSKSKSIERYMSQLSSPISQTESNHYQSSVTAEDTILNDTAELNSIKYSPITSEELSPGASSIPSENQTKAESWVAENSSLNEDFLGKFYENSRLHHLSIWKNELLEMTRVARHVSASNPKKKSSHLAALENQYRTIMHVDMDCFFVSVSLLDQPELIDKPVGVSHSQGNHGSSDVASCNYIARKYGISNGMSIGTAKQKCPDLVILPYDFARYKSVSLKLYEVFGKYADKLQPVSCDEALLDVSNHITELGMEEALELAKEIRASIFEVTKCHASVGISNNILLARLATKHAKPAGQHYLQPEDAIDFLDSKNVDELPGVGWAMRKKLAAKDIRTCRDLRKHTLETLQKEFGNGHGQMLYNFCRGIDHRELQTENHIRKSIGTNVSWGIRFETEEQVLEFLEKMSEEVSKRMKAAGVRGKNVSIRIYQKRPDAKQPYKHLGHGECDVFGRSHNLPTAIDEAPRIAKEVIGLYKVMKIPPKEVRGIGIHFTKLVDASIKDHQQPTIADFVKGRRHEPSDKLMQKPQDETTIVENESPQHPPPKISDIDNNIKLPDNQRELSSRDKAKSPNVKTSSDNLISPSIKKPKLTSSPNKVVQTKLNFTTTTPKRTSTKLKPDSTSLLWSQVDLATFKELPPDIQKDVKRMYQIPLESEPPIPTEPQHTSDSHAIENESECLSKMDDSWDPEVFQQLPPEIRQEVIDEWKRHKLVDRKLSMNDHESPST